MNTAPTYNTFLRAAIEHYLGRRLTRGVSRDDSGRLRYGWHDDGRYLGCTLDAVADALDLMTF